MKYAKNSPISIAPAAPGYVVVHEPEGVRDVYPVVAWATVLVDYDGTGAARTSVEAVFLYCDHLYTQSQWEHDMQPRVALGVEQA